MTKIFLNNYAVLSPGYGFSGMDGYTQIGKSIGVNTFDEKIGDYHVIASAQKFRADIAFYANKGKDDKDLPTLPLEEMILFDGVFSVYYNSRENKPSLLLPKHPTLRGKIWNAYPESTVYEGDAGLQRIIVGPERELTQNRLAFIIEGYHYQQEQFEREDKAFAKEMKKNLGFI